MQIMIRKETGENEPLDLEKIKRSLARAGANRTLTEDVIEAILPSLKDGMSTREIYDLAFSNLRELKPGVAARFSLKDALFRMGPDGYPFETFIGSLLKGRGYSTLLRQTLMGKCVTHEIDVVASRPAMNSMPATKAIIECKFHNSPAMRCHIQSALYSWARYLDVRERSTDIKTVWLATNTKFSFDTIQYADCVGLKLLGWSFPGDESIQVRIEENKLYPITILPSLDRRTFNALHSAGIILAKELADAPDEQLAKLGITPKLSESLKEQAKKVISNRS